MLRLYLYLFPPALAMLGRGFRSVGIASFTPTFIFYLYNMKILGNIIWLLFGGIIIAIEYFIASLALMITIIGIPFGVQTMKLGLFALWPFGAEARVDVRASGCLYIIMNILWLLLGGLVIALSHAIFGLLLSITIIGIPFGMQHFKLAAIALSPFGRDIIRG